MVFFAPAGFFCKPVKIGFPAVLRIRTDLNRIRIRPLRTDRIRIQIRIHRSKMYLVVPKV